MRFAAITALAGTLLCACSGASSSDLFAGTTTSTSGTDPAATNGTGPAGSSGSNGNPETGGENGGDGKGGDNGGGENGGTDAGTGGGTDAGTGVDASVGPCAGGQAEVEPNDAPGAANAITGLELCGAIAKSSGKADVDYFTFVLPPTSKTITVNYTATDRVVILVSVAGQTIDITQKNAKPLPVVPGGKYQVEVQGVSTTPGYTLRLVE